MCADTIGLKKTETCSSGTFNPESMSSMELSTCLESTYPRLHESESENLHLLKAPQDI